MQIETLNPIKIRVFGEERFDFLQNIITNDLTKLKEELKSYILSPQGKILYEIIITKSDESYELVCSNDQNDLPTFLNKYALLSDVKLSIEKVDKREFDKNYIINQLSTGIIDSNLLKQSSLLPSEVNDKLVDYSKGCFVGQEVVSRIKHRQLNKKKLSIKVFEKKPQKLPNNSEILIVIKNTNGSAVIYIADQGEGIPMSLRDKIGNKVYGCDDCLAVCPWNKFAKKSKEIGFHPRDDLIKPNLGTFLSLTDEDFRKKFSKSSIKRIGRDRFLRNVLIAVGNSKEKKYKKDIEALLEDESSTVRAMAVWSLKQVIDSNHIENYKKKYFALEKNKNVQEEWLN